MRRRFVPGVPRRFNIPQVEPLEGRRLLHALPDGTEAELSVRVNFQPSRAAVPPGYVVDAGLVFADRGGGLAYGWDFDNASARDRNSAASPDQRYDTLTHTQLYGVRTWELAVPNGDYDVRIVAGDPAAQDGVYSFSAEGVVVAAGRPTAAARWVDGTRTVSVADGRLTVSNSAGSINNKLAFLEVRSVHAASTLTTVTVAASDATAAEAGADTGTFLLARSGPTTSALTVAYSVGGTATAGADYQALSGSVTIPAGAASAAVIVRPLADAVAEGTETVALTLVGGTGYAVGAPAAAQVSISDAAAPAPAGVAAWSTHAPAPVARFEANNAVVAGKIYVFGGYDKNILGMARSDVYDPAADRWARIADLPQPVTHAGVATDGQYVYLAGGFVGERSYEVTAAVWRYDTRANAWAAAAPLPAARSAGGLVRLGRQLHFFGGAGLRLQQDFADHWVLDLDAAPGTPGAAWRPLTPLPVARNHFGYAAVNNRIYCIGGQFLENEKSGNVALVHAYNPSTNQWSAVASLPFPLSHTHTTTVVIKGRIVTVGGKTNDPVFPKTVADVLSYDRARNVWVALPSLPDVRQAPAAQVVRNRLYVTTGTPTGVRPQTTTWSRQMTNVWDAGAAMPLALGETAGGIIGKRLYLVGEGADATLAYDLSTGKWMDPAALARRPFVGHHHAAEVVGGKLYLFGGLRGSAEGKVQIYDPAANRWTLGAPMPFAAGSSASALIGGKVYVAGGIVGLATTGRAVVYNPKANSWAEVAPMPKGRNHAAAATDGKRLFVFGGRGPGSGDSNTVANGFDTVQVYDPATNTWVSSDDPGSTIRPLPQARGGMGKAVYSNGEFYVFGGETLTGAGATAAGVYHRVDVYHVTKNTWRLGPPVPTARHGIFPLLFAGRVYVAGGGVRAGASASGVLEILNLA